MNISYPFGIAVFAIVAVVVGAVVVVTRHLSLNNVDGFYNINYF